MLVVLIVLGLPCCRAPGRSLALAPARRAVVSLVAGLSLAVASANVVFRDVEHLVSAALLPWFFLTPILVLDREAPRRSRTAPPLKELLDWGNPTTPPIEALRAPLYAGPLPRWPDVAYPSSPPQPRSRSAPGSSRRVDDRIAVEL